MSLPTEEDLKERYTEDDITGRLVYLTIGCQTFQIETYKEDVEDDEEQKGRVDFFRNMLAKALLTFLKENQSESSETTEGRST